MLLITVMCLGAAAADGPEIHSLRWYIDRAEAEAARWGNPHQQAYSFAEIAGVLADHNMIEEALAVAQRIDNGPALLSARYRIAAAYARTGKVKAARTLAITPLTPDARVEPDATIEVECRIALTLAEICCPEDAERMARSWGEPRPQWRGETCASATIAAARARIHAALAAHHAREGHRQAYEDHIRQARVYALSIPGDIAKMWGELLSSKQPAGTGPGPNPINAIHKSKALKSVAAAHAQADDLDRARETLGAIAPGRHHDASSRTLVDALIRSGRIEAACELAEAITTDDHRELALLSIVEARAKAGDVTAASKLAGRIRKPDRRVVADMHLAAARVREGKTVELEALLTEPRDPSSATEAETRERLARGLSPRSPIGRPATTARRFRPKTYRSLARIQAEVRAPAELAAWIESLASPEARYHAYLGAAEGSPVQRKEKPRLGHGSQ
jgi:hypothetical protein